MIELVMLSQIEQQDRLLPSTLCRELSDSSLLADLNVAVSPLPPENIKMRRYKHSAILRRVKWTVVIPSSQE